MGAMMYPANIWLMALVVAFVITVIVWWWPI